MADISKYKDSNNNIHNLKDTAARSGLNNKVDKEAGKSLSTNDYTDTDKTLVQNSPITVTATGAEITASTAQGNLNALTIYGKSEIVDGAITSAGEGWATVDLGTLNWTKIEGSAGNYYFLSEIMPTLKIGGGNYDIWSNLIMDGGYSKVASAYIALGSAADKTYGGYDGGAIRVKDTSYTDPADFKAAMNGVLLCYQLADPTQGNCIAVKTDNGSGINGTMATFSTGTPLRGIPEGARDVMTWDGSAGTVTKNCNEVDLGTLTWGYDSSAASNPFFYASDINIKLATSQATNENLVCVAYNTYSFNTVLYDVNIDKAIGVNSVDNAYKLVIKNADYSDPADFKTAMNGVKLVYELATPTTQPLTSTENNSIAGLRTFQPQTHAQNNAGATMTVEAYAGTANGKAVNAIDINKETKSVTLPYADYVALQNKDPETSYYCPDAPDTWIFGYDLDNDDENPFTRVSYPADVDNAFFTPAAMDYTNDRFNYGSWNFKPGDKFMPRPCMLKYDETVDYYLDPDDNTKKADGTASDVADTSYGGNAMMEWGLIYTKRWEENGVYKFRCSNVRLGADWDCWCNYDKNNNVIPHFYTPIYFGSYDGTRMRSLSGQSNMVNTTRQQEIDRAMANGEGWFTEVYADSLLFQDLCIMMSRCTDVQTAFGTGRVKSTNTGAIAPGMMNTKGMFWGSTDQTSGVKIFGMENPYGNIWRGKAGYMYINGIQTIKMTRGTYDGSTATDYNITGSGYIAIPNSTISAAGWQKGMTTTPYGRFPKITGGASNKYESDYVYVNNSGTFYLLFGGNWAYGLNAGFFVSLNTGAAYASSGVGAALSCKPLA